jgi:hypothetical protein
VPKLAAMMTSAPLCAVFQKQMRRRKSKQRRLAAKTDTPPYLPTYRPTTAGMTKKRFLCRNQVVRNIIGSFSSSSVLSSISISQQLMSTHTVTAHNAARLSPYFLSFHNLSSARTEQLVICDGGKLDEFY